MNGSVRRLWIAWGLVAWVALEASAQLMPARRFGVTEGLAQSQVTALTQDRFGFLWITTQGGVSRYDGRRLETYTTRHGLPEDVVTAVATGHGDSVWFGTEAGGVARSENGSVRTVVPPGGGLGRVNDLSVMSDGSVLVAAMGSVAVVDGTDVRIVREDGAMFLVKGGPDRVWVVAGDSVQPFDATSEALGPPIPVPAGTTAACPTPTGGVAVLDGDGRVLTFPDGGLRDLRLPPGQVPAGLVPAGDDGYWVGTDRGLWRCDVGSGAVRQRFQREVERISVSALVEDREGGLWIGTWGLGLFQVRPGGVTVFTADGWLPAATVWAFVEDADGCVWMATHGGGAVSWCDDRPGPRLTVENGLATNDTLSIAVAPAGDLWVGTAQGVSRRSPGGIVRTWSVGEGLPGSYVGDIVVASDGSVWLATDLGLARWDGRRWTSWTADDGLPASYLNAVAEDGSGALWLATHTGGVVRFDGAEFRSFTAEDGLPNDRVWSIMVHSNGEVWAGTDAGVWIHPVEGGGPDRVVGLDEGLASANVVFLVEDTDGAVWAGTTRGVAKVTPSGEVTRTLTASDGLSDTEAAQGAVLVDGSGALWFGMAEGVTRIAAGTVEPNTAPPVVVLEGASIDGEPVRRPPLSSLSAKPGDELVVGPESSELRVDVAAPCLRAGEQVRFRYRLLGSDRRWSRPTEEAHATFRKVPPGRYTVQVEARNEAGVWSSAPLQLPVRFRPPWYATSWARIGGVLGLVALVAGVFAVRMAAARRRQRELEREVEARTRELRQANERISEQNELLEEMTRTDPLTGLGNRRVVAEQLPVEVALAHRTLKRRGPEVLPELHGVGVILIDVDHFKRVNDELGHDAGDRLLVGLARLLERTVREVDLVVRWGGEEFLAVARGIDSQGLKELAVRLLDSVQRCELGDRPEERMRLRVSAGFVQYPLAAGNQMVREEWGMLIDLADRLLYMAKERGRARAVGIVPVPGGPPADEQVLLERLRANPENLPDGIELVEIRS